MGIEPLLGISTGSYQIPLENVKHFAQTRHSINPSFNHLIVKYLTQEFN